MESKVTDIIERRRQEPARTGPEARAQAPVVVVAAVLWALPYAAAGVIAFLPRVTR